MLEFEPRPPGFATGMLAMFSIVHWLVIRAAFPTVYVSIYIYELYLFTVKLNVPVLYTGYTQNNGAVSIVFTIDTAPFFCVYSVQLRS